MVMKRRERRNNCFGLERGDGRILWRGRRERRNIATDREERTEVMSCRKTGLADVCVGGEAKRLWKRF